MLKQTFYRATVEHTHTHTHNRAVALRTCISRVRRNPRAERRDRSFSHYQMQIEELILILRILKSSIPRCCSADRGVQSGEAGLLASG